MLIDGGWCIEWHTTHNTQTVRTHDEHIFRSVGHTTTNQRTELAHRHIYTCNRDISYVCYRGYMPAHTYMSDEYMTVPQKTITTLEIIPIMMDLS